MGDSTTDVLPPRYGNQYLAPIICNIGVFCFGTSLGWSIQENRWVVQHPGYSFVQSNDQWDAVRLFLPIGTFLGCIPLGILLKMFGCKPLMLFQCIFGLLGWLLLIFANNVYMLYLGRFLQGLCGAAVSVSVPIYIIEISSLKNRGSIGSIFYAALMYGVGFGALMLTWCSITVVNSLNMCLTLLSLSVMVVPESPMHYILRGEFEKAKTSLIWLRNRYDIDTELDAMVDVVTRNSLAYNNRCSALCATDFRRGFCRGIFLLVIYQTCGGVTILYCLSNFLGKLSDSTYQIYTAIVLTSVIAGHSLCFMIVDRIGFRMMLLISSIVMLFNGIFLWSAFGLVKARNGIIMLNVWLFFASFSSGFGPIGWILNVQLIVEALRPYGCSISVMISCFIALLLTIWEDNGLVNVNIFFIIMIFACLGFLFTLLFLPETKGLNTTQIQALLRSQSLDEE